MSCRGRCRPGAVLAGRMYARSIASRNTHAPRGSGGGEGHCRGRGDALSGFFVLLCVPAIVTGNRVVAQPGLVIPEFVYARPATGFEQHQSLFCHNIVMFYYISFHRMIHRTSTPHFFRFTMNWFEFILNFKLFRIFRYTRIQKSCFQILGIFCTT